MALLAGNLLMMWRVPLHLRWPMRLRKARVERLNPKVPESNLRFWSGERREVAWKRRAPLNYCSWMFVFFVIWQKDENSSSFTVCVKNTVQSRYILFGALGLCLFYGSCPESRILIQYVQKRRGDAAVTVTAKFALIANNVCEQFSVLMQL